MAMREMPFLILNLGVEMLFVLNSRLHAQAVPPDKATDVLRDVGTNIFDAAFVNELFKPQPMYSSASVARVFTALASSAVMRLSENSMRKLYDLVYMTVKYLVFTLRHPLELLELTLNHLDAAQLMLPAEVRPLASAAEERVMRLASTLSVGDWASMRQALLNFFSGRHVRVSVFVDNKAQDGESGAFYIPRDAFLSPSPGCKPPGLVHVAGSPQPGTFSHSDAHLPYPSHIPLGSWRPQKGALRMTSNGFDLYAVASATAPPTSAAAGAVSTVVADPLARQTREIPMPTKLGAVSVGGVNTCASAAALPLLPITNEEEQCAYDAELNFVARLIGSADRARGVRQFELDLFRDDADCAGELAAGVSAPAAGATSRSSASKSGGATVAPAVPVTRMTASAVKEQNRRLLGIMSDFHSPKGAGSSDAGSIAPASSGKAMNDLLDIMDEL
ncbi:hypothetical protein GH5_06844 [Leishmania sp. Ghana 2012 LV757]|uniref:hypothetical protein n=1 Tax=Leishmania sp. Ghana 2012 LV757 TaxID=2803181 RepID=UPI001B730B19|nr:hypothetical protein GH5_06844 [Leishmania sp. Ghana 2012 LV757]